MSDVSEPVLVNKAELAEALGVSLPTIGALLKRYPDMPVVEPGTNGSAWKFDLVAVTAFVAERKAEEARGKTARSDLLAQFSLPIDDITPDFDQALKPAERLALARARAAERDLALKSGLLTPTTEVRTALNTAFTKLSADLRTFLRQVSREHGWPDAVLRRHEAELAETQTRFVRDAAHYLTDTPPPHGPDGQLRLA